MLLAKGVPPSLGRRRLALALLCCCRRFTVSRACPGAAASACLQATASLSMQPALHASHSAAVVAASLTQLSPLPLPTPRHTHPTHPPPPHTRSIGRRSPGTTTASTTGLLSRSTRRTTRPVSWRSPPLPPCSPSTGVRALSALSDCSNSQFAVSGAPKLLCLVPGKTPEQLPAWPTARMQWHATDTLVHRGAPLPPTRLQRST